MQTLASTANALLKVGVDQLEKAARSTLKAILSSALDDIFDCTTTYVGSVLVAWTVGALIIFFASRLPDVEHVETLDELLLCLLIGFSKRIMQPVDRLLLLRSPTTTTLRYNDRHLHPAMSAVHTAPSSPF
ncbi:hypothetical protein SPRG_14453 [Saprolegnia parasitica CBS 223.65]|uniref:Uncharacterized protein n=1 Tax=Saprolegnia parasitica (strain CBS 223.65) TaxID=695850 RepID=A0A067BPY8_SAPPC|nr:hypothetical protein SPRG_14453 [Saprolegnia parasitica CBS 223.65]KDO20318.1 hypothetical protein SPRG_14453 [Saprolegnia parasitica CBS 223.65]|eukprot:XP_012208987.1 hypothetical protein SPRG_14453 [Saprolegnia parasitica CBS 223.65]